MLVDPILHVAGFLQPKILWLQEAELCINNCRGLQTYHSTNALDISRFFTTELVGGRKGLPRSFLNRFTRVVLSQLPDP